MFKVMKAYNDTLDRYLPDHDALMAFVQRKATKLNYGLYRTWTVDGVMYFDCGPTVYKVMEVQDNETN